METLPRDLVAHVKDAYLGYGADKDPDGALDDARAAARDEYGHAGVVPSIADALSLDVEVEDDKVMSRSQAIRLAQERLASGVEPGKVYGVRVGADAGWRRRRVNLNVVDVELEVGTDVGELSYVTQDLQAAIMERLQASGVEVDPAELLEVVDVRRIRARYKPVVTSHKGGSVSDFVVWTKRDHKIVSSGHATASEARRAGVEILKAGGVEGDEQVVLEVVKVVTRGQEPLLTLERTRVAQRGALRLTFALEKDPTKTKHVGWLFYGVLGGATEVEGEDVVDEVPAD